ncbi:4'-phosphopantetheinyl transferase superfamily protein [Paraclostridium ghonii]|uniref:4'-phosphopantetheinyl transferase n=1 Tax=Paraclostridium ghonii TaxID=29358 RepID=A0ABU0N048_9FIRM|nr:4'-phosphopantetheinyl transferase superfamily protein [Paeniclostridium ghonii]MDQ0556543.1 4'-phosphopantetheinyl transferase [Paeniclostridium ghonii]
MIDIYAVNLCKNENESKISKAIKFLPYEKKEKVSKFLGWKDKERTTLGELLIRTIIINTVGISNESISFYKSEYGKPFLNYDYDLHFNISHSGDWVVCSVDSRPIGIDIEEIRTIDCEVFEKFFFESEFKQLCKINGIKKMQYFYDLWTLKESYIKADGRGLSIPLNSFEIINGKDGIKIGANKDNKKYFFKQYNIDDNYKLSVCATNDKFTDHVIIKKYDEVINEFVVLACRSN